MLILALCLTPALARADVQRGDHGEEVRYLQWLLQQTGLLTDKPDGSFGPRTEQAVIEYQRSKGLEETGIADDALMLEMDKDRVHMDQEAHGSDYYQPYPGAYEPAMVADYGAPSHCRTTVLRDILYRDSCTDHKAFLEQEYNLAARGDADSFAEAAGLWRQALDAQFQAWTDGVLDARRKDIEAARDAWNACFESQYRALSALLADPAVVERQHMLMLKNYAGTICEFLSGDMPTVPDELYPSTTGASSAEKSCAQWSINSGTEFFTGCAVHAPLFDREYAWTSTDAEDGEALNALLADWDQALDDMYDQWADDCGDEADVRAAQEACKQALACQDGALAGDALAPLFHVRAVQLECARLCELLNGNV